jgi:signal transduction histidine kinase
MKKSKNIIFYLIIFYILIAGIWWSYLLSNKNLEVKNAQIENIKIKYPDRPIDEIQKLKDYQQVINRFQRQRWMIIGEGTVFMFLLLMGLWRIYNIRQKEIQLALQQQNFLLSITHELKSPIASVQLILETLKKRQLSQEQIQMLTNNALKDNDRLNKLVQDLLLAARMEGGYQYVFVELDILEVIKECIEWNKMKFKGNINLKLEGNDFLIKKGDRSTLLSVFSNLLENAIKYSESSDQIDINLSSTVNNIKVEVIDYGKGIPKSEKDKIFDKFYRIGDEETRTAKGTGLGLYIVKKIIESHYGTIIVKENKIKGTNFQIELPRE